MKWFLIVLVSLALAGCTGLSGPQRIVAVGLCKAQCPMARTLGMRGCAEIDAEAEPTLYEVCVDEIEAVHAICPGLCESAFPLPEPAPEE